MSEEQSTRQQIVEAAKSEFLAKGFDGARMQHITDQIGVTKAMIHYYFNTKQELFEHVFGVLVQEVFGDLNEVYQREVSLFKKIEEIIEFCLQKADTDSPKLAFIIIAINRKPDLLQPIFEEKVQTELSSFESELQTAADNYEIASVQAYDLLVNIFSLCFYPALAGPLHQSLFKTVEHTNNVESGSHNRKGVVLDTILNWLTA